MDADSAWGRREVAIALTVLATSLAACGSAAHPTAHPKATPMATPTPNPSASFEDKYTTLHPGLTLDAVRSIMGSAGSTMSEADNGAGTTSIVVQWVDPKTAAHSIIVSFVNNVEQTKAANGF